MFVHTTRRARLGDGLPVVTGVAVQFNGTATAPLAPAGTVLGVDPANPSNYLVAGNPGYPPYSIPQMLSGASTAQPGYALTEAVDEAQATYGSTFYQVAPGQFSPNPEANATYTTAYLEGLIGTAAGVGTNGTLPFVLDAYGPASTGMTFTLNADGQTFTGSDGKVYTLAQVQAVLAGSGAPVVTQQTSAPLVPNPLIPTPAVPPIIQATPAPPAVTVSPVPTAGPAVLGAGFGPAASGLSLPAWAPWAIGGGVLLFFLARRRAPV